MFEPYIIFDKAGKKIAFIGVTTPTAITGSSPKFFQDENGNYIYDLLQKDNTGQAVYDAIQKSADDARAEGADYVILLGHLGMSAAVKPWDYASVATNTSGIDAILDGHSHEYHLEEQGGGFSMFSEEDVVSDVMVDNEAVMKYIEETLGGVIGEEYADPYGSGRITAVE